MFPLCLVTLSTNCEKHKCEYNDNIGGRKGFIDIFAIMFFNGGMPSDLVQLSPHDVAEQVLDLLAQGNSLNAALAIVGDGAPTPRRFLLAVARDPDLQLRYVAARELQAEYLAEQTVEIADTEPDAQRARNRITARQWMASKLAPQRFGDRIDVHVSQRIDMASVLAEARARRSISDQRNIEDAQLIETKAISFECPTDTQSADAVSVALDEEKK